MAGSVADLLDPSQADLRHQWRLIRDRTWAPQGKQQLRFDPVETLLCMAASLVVDHRRFGSSSAPRAPSPVPELALLFRRPNSSVLAKMANLYGSRAHGARHDQLVGRSLAADAPALVDLYRRVVAAARAEGFGPHVLPDFLAVEHDGEFVLLGQDELDDSAIEQAMDDLLRGFASDERPTEREMIGTIRIGQNGFARSVLDNCGHQCVFCGLAIHHGRDRWLLVASHIKPWRDSTPAERLDFRNGLAACPTHDRAFDTGLLAVNGGHRIHLAPSVASAVDEGGAAQATFGRPPLRERIVLPVGGRAPGKPYLDWHREHIFRNV